MQRVDISNFYGKKCALVLSGGVVKAAAWHLGVAMALEELGFTFKSNSSPPDQKLEISTYVGSSAGSLINLYLASGYHPTDVLDAFLNKDNSRLKPISYKQMLSLKKPFKVEKRLGHDPFDSFPKILRKILDPILTTPGLFSTLGLLDYLKENVIIGGNFEDYLADVFVVATQLDHSRKVIFSKFNYPNPSHDSTATYYTGIPVAEATAASMSVPPFYTPYPILNSQTGKTDYYIDGEIRETLSTHVAVDNNCEFIISSWTHTPYHFQNEIGSLVHYGLPAICTQAIFLMIQKKIVSSRADRLKSEDILDSVNEYLKTNNFDEVHRKKLTSILERKMNYKRNVYFIDICPKHENYKLFFNSSFSLNPDKMSDIVSSGFKRTIEVFKRSEWES